jgi:hypothetical protein
LGKIIFKSGNDRGFVLSACFWWRTLVGGVSERRGALSL